MAYTHKQPPPELRPMLINILRWNEEKVAVMLLAVCFENGYSDDEANFLCYRLAEAITSWDDTDDNRSEFVLCIIYALLSLSYESRGRALIIRSEIIIRLSQVSEEWFLFSYLECVIELW